MLRAIGVEPIPQLIREPDLIIGREHAHARDLDVALVRDYELVGAARIEPLATLYAGLPELPEVGTPHCRNLTVGPRSPAPRRESAAARQAIRGDRPGFDSTCCTRAGWAGGPR